MGNGTRECEWRHAPEAHGGFGGFWKSQWVELKPASGEDDWLSLACQSQASGLWGRCHTRLGGRWKSQNRKNVYLSSYVEEPLNSKVIKSFVPELRSRYVFFVFWDSYVLCIYVMNIMNVLRTGMNMSISRIHIWLWYTKMLRFSILVTAPWKLPHPITRM